MNKNSKPQTVIVNNNSGQTYQPTPIELLLVELAKNGDKVLIGLVHESMYVVMKGMFAIIKPNNPSQLHAYLNSPADGFSRQENVVTKFWEKTQLATRVMVLPFEWVKSEKLDVPEFESVVEFNRHMLDKIQKAPGMENPFYFRMGQIK